jgi:hypothetical protein
MKHLRRWTTISVAQTVIPIFLLIAAVLLRRAEIRSNCRDPLN